MDWLKKKVQNFKLKHRTETSEKNGANPHILNSFFVVVGGEDCCCLEEEKHLCWRRSEIHNICPSQIRVS